MKIPDMQPDLVAQIASLTTAVRMLTLELVRRGDSSARLLKPDEVAKLFGYKSVTKVYALIQAGVIPTVPLDDDEKGTKRIPLVGLQALIAKKLEDSPVIDQELLERLLGEEG